MFRKSAICIAVGVLGFGVNFDDTRISANDNAYQFLKGFSWGSTARAAEQCVTENGGWCPNYPSAQPDPDPPYIPPPLIPPEPPYCGSGCDGGGGGGGGGGGSDNESSRDMTQQEINDALSVSILAAAGLQAILEDIDAQKLVVTAARKNSLIESYEQLSSFISILQSANSLDFNDVASLLSSMTATTLSLLTGYAVTSTTAAALATTLGLAATAPASLVVSTVIGAAASIWFAYSYGDDIEAFIKSRLTEVFEGDWWEASPIGEPDPFDPNPYCRLRDYFGTAPCLDIP